MPAQVGLLSGLAGEPGRAGLTRTSQLPYSGSGYLMARYMGSRNRVAVLDEPEKVGRLVRAVNACNLRILDAIIDGPFETLFISDNYDSNVRQRGSSTPMSASLYRGRLAGWHAKGKQLAVHVDGESRASSAGWPSAAWTAPTRSRQSRCSPRRRRDARRGRPGFDPLGRAFPPPCPAISAATGLRRIRQALAGYPPAPRGLLHWPPRPSAPDAPFHRIAMMPDLVGEIRQVLIALETALQNADGEVDHGET